MKVPFFRLSPVSKEIENVRSVLESGWLTTGKWVKDFEELFADYCGVKHALAVNSCTAALHLAVEALGIGPGDKVVVPSLTFTASAEVIRYVGADPVFIDIDPDTLLITAEAVETAILNNSNVKAVIAVHFGGQSVELTSESGVLTACEKYGIKLIQDAAHAFPSYDIYGPVGSIGDVTCFSFYANKTITCGEGGMLVTNNDDIAKRAKMMRLHGIDRDVWDRFTSSKAGSWVYDVKAPGFKYNLPDINAAVGVAQFEKAWEFRERRQEIASKYAVEFANLDGVNLIKSRVNPDHHSYHLFPIILTDAARLDRDAFIGAMTEKGIGTSVHYRPLHHMSYYRKHYGLEESFFPNTEGYWKGCVSLPLYPDMSDSDVDAVVTIVKSLLM
ncbi:DegT/DnrJ/EryC1/StrS family aminotransferase [uncultured Alcanivorax sp.]|uniref:DegT/DnrJ/EryC1/StrS family aminotransferase n=1 Tax=uncultured Alcanivorax sp. TaxID=191215 RepID=UPI002603271A|nr:DegT/DnrJ/EryC1/StrS family aminotransferase [uncultured Alcanivorax sp.]